VLMVVLGVTCRRVFSIGTYISIYLLLFEVSRVLGSMGWEWMDGANSIGGSGMDS